MMHGTLQGMITAFAAERPTIQPPAGCVSWNEMVLQLIPGFKIAPIQLTGWIGGSRFVKGMCSIYLLKRVFNTILDLGAACQSIREDCGA